MIGYCEMSTVCVPQLEEVTQVVTVAVVPFRAIVLVPVKTLPEFWASVSKLRVVGRRRHWRRTRYPRAVEHRGAAGVPRADLREVGGVRLRALDLVAGVAAKGRRRAGCDQVLVVRVHLGPLTPRMDIGGACAQTPSAATPRRRSRAALQDRAPWRRIAGAARRSNSPTDGRRSGTCSSPAQASHKRTRR